RADWLVAVAPGARGTGAAASQALLETVQPPPDRGRVTLRLGCLRGRWLVRRPGGTREQLLTAAPARQPGLGERRRLRGGHRRRRPPRRVGGELPVLLGQGLAGLGLLAGTVAGLGLLAGTVAGLGLLRPAVPGHRLRLGTAVARGLPGDTVRGRVLLRCRILCGRLLVGTHGLLGSARGRRRLRSVRGSPLRPDRARGRGPRDPRTVDL